MNIGSTELLVIFTVLVALAIWLGLAYLCGYVARNRGHSFVPFFIGGLLIWPLALLLAIVLKPASE